MIRWAFDIRLATQFAILFGISFLARYFWNGGSILRYGWFFAIVTATCLLKKNRILLSAIALSYACAVRIFPIFLIPPVFAFFIANYRSKKQSILHFALGLGLAGIFLLGFGIFNNGRGVDAFIAIDEKLSIRANVPPPNNIGIKTFFITSIENLDGQLMDENSYYETNSITKDILRLVETNKTWMLLSQLLVISLSIWLAIKVKDPSTALLVGF